MFMTFSCLFLKIFSQYSDKYLDTQHEKAQSMTIAGVVWMVLFILIYNKKHFNCKKSVHRANTLFMTCEQMVI